ncbi:HvfX family Cu-binding RiPP maturation protein [Pseudomonas nitroreducens]|uniref:HvfX family Cu-binding RiPP maturation protein n=1 Tax=Pseudomonas nitroreducens TaxID=46680 RepID=UPI0020A0EEC5|nr:DoxX family protein [Pseudomonas nitroreducens]MCP1626936.1 putative oxidoreductase [Pseudomonas nitroreducens]
MTLLTLNPLKTVFDQLDRLAAWGWDIPLRLFLAWEFFESGLEKWHGDNWFEQIHASFPFPFNHFSAGFDWQVSMWAELIAPVMLLLGLATRFASSSLIVVTLVAIAAVHWPAQWSSLAELAQGYSITDHGFGNYKLPLIYLVALVPLVLKGSGALSVDGVVRRFLGAARKV